MTNVTSINFPQLSSNIKSKLQKNNNRNEQKWFSRKGFKMGCLNIHHINPKLDEIKILLEKENPLDLFGMVETFLNEDTCTDTLHIDGYKIERKDRHFNTDGRGIVTYIKNEVLHERRKDIEIGGIESLWVEIKFPKTKSLLIGLFYRPPNSLQSWIDSFEIEIEKALSENKEVIVLGDFNINYKDVVINQKWVDCVEFYGLDQLVNTPTRVTDKSETTIDHVYTTAVENIIEVNVPKYSISDHYPVCVTRKLNPQVLKYEHLNIEYRSLKKT